MFVPTFFVVLAALFVAAEDGHGIESSWELPVAIVIAGAASCACAVIVATTVRRLF